MAAFNCRSPKGFRPDLAVIGAGSAAAIRGAEPGANVSLVGHGTVGGTCVSIGCVPSKTLIRASEALHTGRVATRFAGIIGDARPRLVGGGRSEGQTGIVPATRCYWRAEFRSAASATREWRCEASRSATLFTSQASKAAGS